jgi:predicted DNA-binding protein
MKKEYDFSKAERGRFYRKDATLRLPIYLDAKLQNQVQDLANRTGRDVSDIVSRIVEKEVRLIDELESRNQTEESSGNSDSIVNEKIAAT